MTINKKIFAELENKKLKQSDLAAFLGLSTGQITAWKKRGTTPPAEYLANICKFIDISIYELLDIENNNINEIEQIYNRLSPNDRAIVDNIFDRYREETSSSITKIS